MSMEGTGAHTGQLQAAAAQGTLERFVPTIAAATTYTSPELDTVGLPRQVVVIGQAAGGNPGVTVDVQIVETTDANYFTVETLVLIPGAPLLTRRYDYPSRAMRVLIHNPAGAPSGIVNLRLLAAA
jgi:hypothetical protein